MRLTVWIAAGLSVLLLSSSHADTVRLECEDFAGPRRTRSTDRAKAAPESPSRVPIVTPPG